MTTMSQLGYTRGRVPQMISDSIKAEIARRGLSASAVAKLAGIKPNVVSRFLAGERDLMLATADKIAAGLGLVVRHRRTPHGGRGPASASVGPNRLRMGPERRRPSCELQ